MFSRTGTFISFFFRTGTRTLPVRMFRYLEYSQYPTLLTPRRGGRRDEGRGPALESREDVEALLQEDSATGPDGNPQSPFLLTLSDPHFS